jgi:hypothetical protein
MPRPTAGNGGWSAVGRPWCVAAANRLVVKASNGDQLLFFATPESLQGAERF